VHAEDNLYMCSSEATEKIKQRIKEHNLNRVVVASCSPRTHEPLFRSVIREAGLNEYLFEMANIRDQCTWVHMHQPEAATKKAKDLVRMAVAKARLLEPLYKKFLSINNACLVIGGGVSGMTAALNLAEQGFEVYLVEKEKELGGNAKHLHYLLNGKNVQEYLKNLIEKVNKHQKIKVYTNAKIINVEGSFGNFKTTITQEDNNRLTQQTIEHGAIIVAIGAKEYKPTEYMYGKSNKILTQLELEEKLSNNAITQQLDNSKTVVMIQCVGSRDNERPYCSRICCSHAVKNAIKIKEINPNVNVFILYRDVRTYGFREGYYTKARQKGVIFIRYDENKKPEVLESENKKLLVKCFDTIIKKDIVIDADMVVLSSAIVPHPENKELAQLLKVPLDQNGFFLEAHIKLRPVDFATDGIFLAGLAHFPKSLEECISQAYAASSRVATVLSKDKIELEATISKVVDENCDGCAYCVDPCPYKALTLIEYMYNGSIKKVVEVDESKCKGCGVCQATCPKKGIFVRGFKLDQILAMVEAALAG
jgi:heterodisulfide reductase subunit A